LLDGLTLFRFAHMWRDASSGGVEAYLWNLNRVLLERNRMRIVQMYLVAEEGQAEIITERVGRGEVVWIPSVLTTIPSEQISYAKRLKARLIRRTVSEIVVNHEMLLSRLADYRPVLGVFHWISRDSKRVIHYLRDKSIPLVVINHFDNMRLKRRMIRRQVSLARAVAGVSEVAVPGFLRNRFANLSDGIDTDFFHPQKANPPDSQTKESVIFFPSRICEEKGHLDAVEALGQLARSGVKAVLVFAGREDSRSFMQKLLAAIAEEGVRERVIFTGELRREDLRDWYAASDIVILPSYSEGLPRVALEAQAMERPILAYDSGGTREAFRDGVSGILLRKGDIHGLSRWLQRLLEEDDSRSAMGKKGREFVVGRFSLDSLVARHERFYENVLNLNR
jgi:glycosyltransferase involved in cell wall biosynthesis